MTHFTVSPQKNFIGKCLESKEATVTKVNDDGEKLIASEHPGKNVIEVQTHLSQVSTLLLLKENKVGIRAKLEPKRVRREMRH